MDKDIVQQFVLKSHHSKAMSLESHFYLQPVFCFLIVFFISYWLVSSSLESKETAAQSRLILNLIGADESPAIEGEFSKILESVNHFIRREFSYSDDESQPLNSIDFSTINKLLSIKVEGKNPDNPMVQHWVSYFKRVKEGACEDTGYFPSVDSETCYQPEHLLASLQSKFFKNLINSSLENALSLKKVFYYSGDEVTSFSFPKRENYRPVPDITVRPWYKRIQNVAETRFTNKTKPINMHDIKSHFVCSITRAYIDAEPEGYLTKTVICQFEEIMMGNYDQSNSNSSQPAHYLGFDFFIHSPISNLNMDRKKLIFSNLSAPNLESIAKAIIISMIFLVLLIKRRRSGLLVSVKRLDSRLSSKKRIRAKNTMIKLFGASKWANFGGEVTNTASKNEQAEVSHFSDSENTIVEVKVYAIIDYWLFWRRTIRKLEASGEYKLTNGYVISLGDSADLRADIKKMLLLHSEKAEYKEIILSDDVLRDAIDNFHPKINRTENFRQALNNFAALQFGEFRFINGRGLMNEVAANGRVDIFAVTNIEALTRVKRLFEQLKDSELIKYADNEHRKLKDQLSALMELQDQDPLFESIDDGEEKLEFWNLRFYEFCRDWFFNDSSTRILVCDKWSEVEKLFGSKLLKYLSKHNERFCGEKGRALLVFEEDILVPSKIKNELLLKHPKIYADVYISQDEIETNDLAHIPNPGTYGRLLLAFKEHFLTGLTSIEHSEDFAILKTSGSKQESIGVMTADYQTYRIRKYTNSNAKFNHSDLELTYSGSLNTSEKYIKPYFNFFKSLRNCSKELHIIFRDKNV